jgi:8-oxo-dGTP pyrophosphatase MutT (NUDIX family)
MSNIKDITFKIGNNKFNYRACAIIINDNKILALKDEVSPYYYLPGGRVQIGETAEEALLREIKEELEVDAKIVRPLWLNQAFFNEDVTKINFHELCIYFLVDVKNTKLPTLGDKFNLRENVHTHEFEWLEFSRLKNEYFYPLFLKEEIYNLPNEFRIRTEIE